MRFVKVSMVVVSGWPYNAVCLREGCKVMLMTAQGGEQFKVVEVLLG